MLKINNKDTFFLQIFKSKYLVEFRIYYVLTAQTSCGN